MNEEINPVDNAVNIMVDDKQALISIDALPIDNAETETDKAGKGRPPHLPNADTRIKVYTLSTAVIAYILNIVPAFTNI